MTTTSSTHYPDSSTDGPTLKSPWKSPTNGIEEMQRRRQRQRQYEDTGRPLQWTPVKRDDELPNLSQTLSDFSITRSDRRLAWSPQPTHSPVPQRGSTTTTPPRHSHSILASPFKSGGTAAAATAISQDRRSPRWDGRWRARSGSIIAKPSNAEGYGVRTTAMRTDVSSTLMDSPSNDSTRSDRVRKWTETTGIAESPSIARIGSSMCFPSPPSMCALILPATMSLTGTPIRSAIPPPIVDVDDAVEIISSPLRRTTASLPRRSPHSERPPPINARKSGIPRNGRSSPLDGAQVIDIFFDQGVASSSSSSESTSSSPIPADRQPPTRPRLLKRRTTSGESGGWSMASKRSFSSVSSSMDNSLPRIAVDERMSPLGGKCGHAEMVPNVDESSRPSPEHRPFSRRDHPAVIIAPRPAMFRNITAPPSARIATPDPINRDHVHTPIPAFVAERPSPFAFVSSGLVKKGTPSSMSNRSTAGSSGLSSNASKHAIVNNPYLNERHRFPSSALASVVTACGMPDTPIKGGSVVEGLPRVVPRLAPVDIVAANMGTGGGSGSAPMARSVSTNRGLRRKRSSMWIRTNSGSVSSLGGSDGFECEPTTPTREDDLAGKSFQEQCTVTPEPPTPVQSYPFATTNYTLEKGKPIDSPSPPHKRFSILSRLKQQRPLARTSNPFLSLAYKLGGEHLKPAATTTTSPVALQPTAEEKRTGGRFEQDFVVLAPVGRGEFSTVWKVREKSSGDIFAVKRGKAFSGAKDRQRQLQEVDILQTLNSHPHSHVVEFHEAWEQNQQLHIRTAFADCGDLATYLLSIADAGGLDEIRCWKVLTEMTCGLRHIHDLGILHLDIKPSNILITTSGSLRIGDFGLSTRQGDTSERVCSRQLGPSPSDASLREGDREYLSPEILRGEFGRSADAFNLGITMLEVFMNVILPSNGDAWQKLRSDDFSDLDEHFATIKTPIAASFGAMSTSLQSVMSFGSCTTYAEDLISPSVNSPLLAVIKGLMLSDPTSRMTIDGIWSHATIHRIAGMLSTCVDSRVSREAHSTHSAEEWSAWERRQWMATSPDATKVEFIGREMPMAQPALVAESDPSLWLDMLAE